LHFFTFSGKCLLITGFETWSLIQHQKIYLILFMRGKKCSHIFIFQNECLHPLQNLQIKKHWVLRTMQEKQGERFKNWSGKQEQVRIKWKRNIESLHPGKNRKRWDKHKGPKSAFRPTNHNTVTKNLEVTNQKWPLSGDVNWYHFQWIKERPHCLTNQHVHEGSA